MDPKISFRTFAPAYLAIIIDSMGFGLVYPLMTELFAGEQGVHLAEGLSISLRHFYLGLSFLLYPLAAFFGASFMGDLSDMYGRKRIMAFCMGGLFFSFFLMGLGIELFSIELLMIGRTLSGLMAGSQPIAQASIIDMSTEKTKPKNLGLMTLVVSAGIVIGPLIGGIFSDIKLTKFFTLATPFYIAAALALIATIWIAAAFPETLKERTQHKRVHWYRPIEILIEGFQSKDIRFLACIFLFMQLGFSLFFQLIQVFISEKFDYSSWQIGVFNGYMGIAFALVVLFGISILLKYWTVEALAMISLFLTGIFLILPMIFPNEVFIWVMAFLAAGFDMVAYGMLMVCFSSAADKQNQGWVMGVFSSIMMATWAVTGFSTNLILYMGLRRLITIGGIFMLFASLLMYVYHRERNKRIAH